MWRDVLAEVRGLLLAASARDKAEALRIDQECGGQETMIGAWLRWRATWLELFAVLFGHRS